jgi:hypothetical protein
VKGLYIFEIDIKNVQEKYIVIYNARKSLFSNGVFGIN